MKTNTFSKLFYINYDIWWCKKIVSELIIHTRANECTWRTKEKNQSKGTGGVLAKDPLKVKLEESSNNAREYEL